MYESSEKPVAMPASSASGAGLAIVPDKRPSHRPGGCVGSILFQLFDWNRRFAKKKLFPRRLLPPVRATKKVSKKFADERMPVAKFLLIAADENRGGFPNQKKASVANAVSSAAATATTARTSEMRSPSLVARLMGLEAMPAAPLDKPRKAVDSFNCHDGSQSSSSSRHDIDLDLKVVASGGLGKQDARPQKVQKTGFFDRRPLNEAAARVGSEVLQLNRTVLSRGRKQHHKLVSPVKSPRLLTRKNSSRLMGAAVKILEPGLQRRSQARCALTYGSPSQRNVGALNSPEKSGEQTRKYISPCKNCGASLVEVADRNPRSDHPSPQEDDRKPSTSDLPKISSSSSSREALNNNRVQLPFYPGEENPSFVGSLEENGLLGDRKQRSQYAHDQSTTNADNSMIRNSSYTCEEKHSSFSSQLVRSSEKKLITDGKQRTQYEQDQRYSSLNNAMPTQRALRQTQVTAARNRITGPNSCSRKQSRSEPGSVSGSRDSLVQNRDTISRVQAKALPRASITCKAEPNQQNLVQQRRPLKGNTQTRGTSVPKSTPPKHRAGRNTSTVVTEARFVNTPSRKAANNSLSTGSKDNEMASSTFNASSRMHLKSDSSAIIGRTKKPFVKSEQIGASFSPKVVNDSRAELSQRLTVRGDELSALLEQKIKELNFLEQDESTSDIGSKSGRSTAAILQELISALTDEGVCETSSSYGCTANKMQEEGTGESAGLSPLEYACDQPSPISILEASFSTDSCMSESLMSVSGQVSNFGVTEESCNKSQESWDAEADFSDSATSCNVGKMETDDGLSCFLDGISLMYNCSRPSGRPQSRLSYIRFLILNLELLFWESFHGDASDAHSSWGNTLLLDSLEMLCNDCQTNSWLSSSFPGLKGGDSVRRFLCDCLVEYLDSKSGKFIITSAQRKKPPSLSSKKLFEDVARNIGSWRELSSMNLDDMIEKEMNCLPERYIDIQSEACETGEEIQQDIFQALVDEAVIEFLPC